MVPLLRAGLALRTAVPLALASDTLSIAVMELVDNGVLLLVPGAMEAGLAEPLFWGSLAFALAVAFVAAFPVNRWLIARGKGHAVVHAPPRARVERCPAEEPLRSATNANATSVGKTIQTPTMRTIAMIANVREPSFGGLPQWPMSSQTASSGSRTESRIRLDAPARCRGARSTRGRRRSRRRRARRASRPTSGRT